MTDAHAFWMRWFAVAAAVYLATSAEAGTIVITVDGQARTMTTTAGQDAFLVRLKNRDNVVRAPAPAQTTAEYVEATIAALFVAKKGESAMGEQEEACVAFRALGASPRATIITQLGGNSPCP